MNSLNRPSRLQECSAHAPSLFCCEHVFHFSPDAMHTTELQAKKRRAKYQRISGIEFIFYFPKKETSTNVGFQTDLPLYLVSFGPLGLGVWVQKHYCNIYCIYLSFTSPMNSQDCNGHCWSRNTEVQCRIYYSLQNGWLTVKSCTQKQV